MLRRAGLVDGELFENIKRRKIGYLGYIELGIRYHLELLTPQNKIEEGLRRVGRRRLSWLRNIWQWTGIQNSQALQNAAISRNI